MKEHPISHEDIDARLRAGGERFEALENGQSAIHQEQKRQSDIQKEILEVLKKMKADIGATKDIVEAWGVAKGIGKFIKWASGIAAGILVLVGLVKAMAKGLL